MKGTHGMHSIESVCIAKRSYGTNITRTTVPFKKVPFNSEEEEWEWSTRRKLREESKMLPWEDGGSAGANQGPEAETVETGTGRAPSATRSGSPNGERNKG